MEHIPSSKNSLSSDSSAESITDSALETPLDTQHTFPLNTLVACKMPVKTLSSRLELLPKRSMSILDSSIGRPQTASHGTYASHDELHKSRRTRRGTNESMSSMASHSSHTSLLRRTLLLVTSSTPSSRPYSAFATPSLLTPRTSVSSLESTSLETPTAFLSSNRHTTAEKPVLCSSPISVTSSLKDATQVTLAADPTTALSPTNSNSLAQFSPTPHATSSLLQFGVTRVQSASNVATGRNGSGHGTEARRRRSRDAARRASDQQYDDDFGPRPKKASSATGWLVNPGLNLNLPSISRALAPDSMDNGGQSKLKSTTDTSSSSDGLSIPGTWDARVVVPSQEIAATPRPAFPIESKAQQPWRRQSDRPVGLEKGKGKATAPAKAPHLQGPTLQRSSSAPPPAVANPSPNSRVSPAAMGLMAREKKFDSSLPSLAAIESGSRLMRSKIVCATCSEVGPDFPRCGRCGEAWCSRECRVEANKESGGKHRCSPSVA